VKRELRLSHVTSKAAGNFTFELCLPFPEGTLIANYLIARLFNRVIELFRSSRGSLPGNDFSQLSRAHVEIRLTIAENASS